MIRLFNTLTRKKEEFKPIKKGEVGMYCCGPTVYNYAHIGNLRTYIFEDILKRVLIYNGFKVKHVMNITDVGHLTGDADSGIDKMLIAAQREGKTVWDIAKFYTEAFFKDIDRLNIIRPDITPKATEHIKEMIELIERLEKKGFTYTAGGNVYYDISKFKDYGKLARINPEELKAGARVGVDVNKKNPHDFVLWFTKSKFQEQEMKWDSPWGRGYPGWHIECSAMAMKYLGEHFDIHCGGIDHIPVHHTNEIAQSEGATGKKWVNYWLHGEFLVLETGRMGKSLGNFVTLQSLIDMGFNPLDYRYFCLNAHYRKQLTFAIDALEGAKNSLRRLREKYVEFKKEAGKIDESNVKKYKEKFLEAINDDLNMPMALAIMWEVVDDTNLNATEKIMLLDDFDRVFGLRLEESKEETVELKGEAKKLFDEREKARKNKDWKKADELRNKLSALGYILVDTPEGTKVKKK